MNETFGQFIRGARERRDMSITAASRLARISPQTWRSLESQATPTGQIGPIMKAARALDNAERFVGDEREQFARVIESRAEEMRDAVEHPPDGGTTAAEIAAELEYLVGPADAGRLMSLVRDLIRIGYDRGLFDGRRTSRPS